MREGRCRDVHVTSNVELRNNVRLLLNVDLRNYVISRQIASDTTNSLSFPSPPLPSPPLAIVDYVGGTFYIKYISLSASVG